LIRAALTPTIIPWRLPTPDAESADCAYQCSLAELYAYSETPREAAAIRLGQTRKLQRMRTLLGLAGSPHANFQTVLVAGTKGKGSMAALLTSILEAAGFRVGRYTQPHLYSHRERIWANGDHISESAFVSTLERLRPSLAAIERRVDDLGPLTTFDVGTALAIDYFAQERVEIAVVEVGVGGENDATNVLDPILALIGPVGMDHSETLGSTIGAIARHKAGVMRSGIDVAVSAQQPEAQDVIREVAQDVGARLLELGREFRWATSADGGGRFHLGGVFGCLDCLETPLLGRCQRDNAAVAVAGALALNGRGWSISEDDIRRGLASVSWPGRFQTVVSEPLTVVDGAHNPPSMKALAETVRECLPGRPISLVIGMSVEKDVAASMAELAPLVDCVVATRSRHPRSCDPERIAAIAKDLDLAVRIVSDPGDAVAVSWSGQWPDGATLVAGSLFLAGDVLEWLQRGGAGRGESAYDAS